MRIWVSVFLCQHVAASPPLRRSRGCCCLQGCENRLWHAHTHTHGNDVLHCVDGRHLESRRSCVHYETNDSIHVNISCGLSSAFMLSCFWRQHPWYFILFKIIRRSSGAGAARHNIKTPSRVRCDVMRPIQNQVQRKRYTKHTHLRVCVPTEIARIERHRSTNRILNIIYIHDVFSSVHKVHRCLLFFCESSCIVFVVPPKKIIRSPSSALRLFAVALAKRNKNTTLNR